jgi:crotonobetainyl-CoA:carnitine CoA-transferase CaiB-like acyl-CoA transferase
MSSQSLFKDLKVIDLSSVLAGPSVGTFFAELGAEVIKIEHPIKKDVTRTWKLPGEKEDSQMSAYFSSVNYKKSYKFLDFSSDKDRNQLFEIVKDADILLANFKKGSQEKLGIGAKELRKINPKLIIGKISGFGEESDRVAYDLILQAETGFMSMNGTSESGPLKMPVALIDVLAAHHLKEGILIALLSKAKEKNFRGKTISVSLYDAAVTSLINQASNYLMTGHIADRIGSLHPNIAPYGELFTTKDNAIITFAIGSNKHFKLLCKWLKKEELINDGKYSTAQERVKNRKELFAALQQSVSVYDSTTILNAMHTLYVPCAKVQNIKEVFDTKEAKQLVNKELIDGVTTQRVTSIAFKEMD